VQVGEHNAQVNYFIGQGVGLRSTAASAGGTPAGRPLEKVTDPFAFEVHRPVQAQEPQLGLPALPAYVPRAHDGELAAVASDRPLPPGGGAARTGLDRATLWPQYWDDLTARPAAGTDSHAQARELLAARNIAVPPAFTADQLPLLAAAGDPRLALAAQAEGGLAGAPELLARYRNAPPAAAALINTAMDARRLGMGIALPLAFLETAASGYLDDPDWDALPEDWLEQALAYTAAPAKGARGSLAPIRPRAVTGPGTGVAYRPADYLDRSRGTTATELRAPLVGYAGSLILELVAGAAFHAVGWVRDPFSLPSRWHPPPSGSSSPSSRMRAWPSGA
jgi:hypothetical protein